MTTVAVSTDSPVVEAPRQPGRVRIFFGDTVGFLGTWLRVLWRHWPALLALGLGATIVRELLLMATFMASRWQRGLGSMLVLSTVPLAALTAMVLMLRVVRPSLPYLGKRSKPEPIGLYLASVLIPFLVFYFAAGYFLYDARRFGGDIDTDILANAILGDQGRFFAPDLPLILGVAVGVFLLRSVLNRFEAVRRMALWALPLAYLEVVWLYATLIGFNLFRREGQDWLTLTRAWRAVVAWWHTELDPANPITPVLNILREAGTAFVDAFDLVVLAPVTGLVAGSIVLAARARRHSLEPAAPTGLRRVLAIGATAGRPIGGRFGLIADGTRRVFQTGVAATMLFCLVYVATTWVSPLLFDLERLAIGPQDPERVWFQLTYPLWFFNDAVGLVMLMSLIAAFVDRGAARIARRAGVPIGPTNDVPVDNGSTGGAVSTVPSQPGPLARAYAGQPTTRLGPPVGMSMAGTPTYGGLSPVTPTYTSEGLPPPPGGPSSTPPAGLTSGLWDREPDEPRQSGLPGDEERGRPGIGR